MVIMLTMWGALTATLVINENINSWSAHTSYGTWTQVIDAGTVNLTRCLVSPNSAASGEGSIGRVQMEAVNGIVEFPELISSGEMEFTFAAGSAGRSVKLQKFVDSVWTDLTTFSGIGSTGARFYCRVGQDAPTRLRLANPSHAIYLHDIFATDFSAQALPTLSIPALTDITYSTAILLSVIDYGGTSNISSRGFCYGTNPLPDIIGSFIISGSGISPMIGTITGLSPNTNYYVRAFATNTSGTGYSEQIMITTLGINAPTIQTSNLVFYAGSTSIQASWTPGNGSRRLVKINTENDFSNPMDGIEYPINTDYTGTGEQAVYCGATQIIEGDPVNAVTVTGLQRNTTYWFRAYEMNGSDATAQYLTSTSIANPAPCLTLNTSLIGYYDDIEGYGAELKTDLHNLLRNTHLTQFSYDALWQQLQYTDEDSTNTNNVIETYSGWSVPKNYYGTGSTQWNREHTWSVSHGNLGTVRPAGTDLHHIRPCDVTVNSAKSNKDFDNGGAPYVDSSPYPGYSSTTGCNTSTYAWEPRPVEKGDVARMLMYMAIRYEGTDSTYNLEIQDSIPTAGSYYGKLSTMLQWHNEDPPDSWERRRNDRIQERQGNRNPFIDHPEFVYRLWTPHLNWAVGYDNNSVVMSWVHAINAVGYRLDISTDSLFTSFVVQDYELDYGNLGNYNVGDLDVVYVRLKAFFGSGYSPYSNVLRVDMNAPEVVISYFNATLIGDQNALLEWTSETETGLLGYQIYRGYNPQLQQAMLVSPLIAATNTSTMQNYSYTDNEIPVSETGGWVYYWLRCMEFDGQSIYIGPDSIYVEPSGLHDDYAPAVQLVSLYPNPFSTVLHLELELKTAVRVELSIYNLKGQKVRDWSLSGARKQNLTWNGLDNNGRQVAAGIYLLQVTSGKQRFVHKLLRLN